MFVYFVYFLSIGCLCLSMFCLFWFIFFTYFCLFLSIFVYFHNENHFVPVRVLCELWLLWLLPFVVAWKHVFRWLETSFLIT